MTTLTVVSDMLVIDEYVDTLSELIEKLDLPYDEMEVFKPVDGVPPRGVVLCVGKLAHPDLLPKDQPLVSAPSHRELLGTAGGVTKLRDSLLLMDKVRNKVQPGEYVVITGDDDGDERAVQFARFLNGGHIAVDIEVSGDISEDEPEDTELLALAITGKDMFGDLITAVWSREALVYESTATVLVHLLRAYVKTAHNGKFDFRWINVLLAPYMNKGERFYPDRDTQLMHHVLYPAAKSNKLKELAQAKLAAVDWEYDVKKYTKGSKAHYERIPAEVLYRYNAGDTFYTWLLDELLMHELELNPEAMRAYQFEMRMSRMYQDIEEYGIWVDEEYGLEVKTELETYIDTLLCDLQMMASPHVENLNPRSPQQVQRVLHARGHMVGSTGAKVLQGLVLRHRDETGEGGTTWIEDFAAKLLEHRAWSKVLSTYVVATLRRARGGRVHPSFLVHGTSTGRTSSKSPNVQNLPNERPGIPSVRRMYGVAPGRALVGVDFAQAELRTMAELSGDPQMIADLQEDAVDFFDNMMPKVFPHVDFTGMTKEQRKPYRLKNKRVVYGSSYGLTAASVANTLTLEGEPTTVEEAETIQDGYLGLYPLLRKWREDTMPAVLTEQGLVTVFGRRFQQDIITEDGWNRVQNQAWAFMPQSTASDVCQLAAMSIHDIFNAPVNETMDAHIVATIHDAIYVDCNEHSASLVQEIVEREMRSAGAEVFKRVPFLTEGHIGRYFSED